MLGRPDLSLLGTHTTLSFPGAGATLDNGGGHDGSLSHTQPILNISYLCLISFGVRGKFYIKTMSARQRTQGFRHEEWRKTQGCLETVLPALGVSGFHPVLWWGHRTLCHSALNLVSFLSHFGQNSSLMSLTLESAPQNRLWEP